MAGSVQKPWWHIQWYAGTDTKEERKHIAKLDLLIVPYAILSYWVKYIDQSNLSKKPLYFFRVRCKQSQKSHN